MKDEMTKTGRTQEAATSSALIVQWAERVHAYYAVKVILVVRHGAGGGNLQRPYAGDLGSPTTQ